MHSNTLLGVLSAAQNPCTEYLVQWLFYLAEMSYMCGRGRVPGDQGEGSEVRRIRWSSWLYSGTVVLNIWNDSVGGEAAERQKGQMSSIRQALWYHTHTHAMYLLSDSTTKAKRTKWFWIQCWKGLSHFYFLILLQNLRSVKARSWFWFSKNGGKGSHLVYISGADLRQVNSGIDPG